MFVCPTYRQRASRKEHEHDRLAAGMGNFQDFLLSARQIQILLVSARILVALVSLFAFQTGIEPETHNDNIAGVANRFYFRISVFALTQIAYLLLI